MKHGAGPLCLRLMNGVDDDDDTLWSPTNPAPQMPALGHGTVHSWYLCAQDPHLLPLSPPSPSQADVRDEDALLRACEGVDCVFHVASYGMSGAEKVGPTDLESGLCLPQPSCPCIRPWSSQMPVLPLPVLCNLGQVNATSLSLPSFICAVRTLLGLS